MRALLASLLLLATGLLSAQAPVFAAQSPFGAGTAAVQFLPVEELSRKIDIVAIFHKTTPPGIVLE